MNYILFNPRNWSFDQMQNNNQNNFGYGRNNGFSQSFPAERSFINDFDGSLVESLLFGDWNTSYARAVSKELSLLPDTEYCFVFWLNGGENDSGSEICRLQIAFGGNWDDCYTYKLNRNYIKPVLHKDGWELYSIPFRTPVAYTSAGFGTVSSSFGTATTGSVAGSVASAATQSGNNDTAPTVAVYLAFVAGNAPMALKPAKGLEAYSDWEDAPDEFVSERPQRHNLVFADGWPSISQYGGDKYSTEALRAKKARNTANTPPIPGVPPVPVMPGIPPIPDIPPVPVAPTEFTLSDDLAEHLDDIEMQRDDLSDRADELNNRFNELLSRIESMTAQGILTGTALDSVTARISAFQSELQCLENRVSELDNQVDGADLEIEMLGMSSDAGEAYLDSLETMLDIEDGHADGMEDSLDSLEEYLDSIV